MEIGGDVAGGYSEERERGDVVCVDVAPYFSWKARDGKSR